MRGDFLPSHHLRILTQKNFRVKIILKENFNEQRQHSAAFLLDSNLHFTPPHDDGFPPGYRPSVCIGPTPSLVPGQTASSGQYPA